MSGFWLVCVTLYTTYNGTRKILKECMSRSVELFIWFQYQLEMVEWVIQSSFFNFTYTKRERKKYKRLRKNLWPFFILKDEIGKTYLIGRWCLLVYLILVCHYTEGTLVSWVRLPGRMSLKVRVVFLHIQWIRQVMWGVGNGAFFFDKQAKKYNKSP